MKVSEVNTTFQNLPEMKNNTLQSNRSFSEFTDSISKAIIENTKDPIDREEDLNVWQLLKNNFKLNKDNPTYEDFVDLKKKIIAFPPLTAKGKVRKEYREYMNRLPKNVRDNIQGILTMSYANFIINKNEDTLNWNNCLSIMKNHVGEIGDSRITDFNLISELLDKLITDSLGETLEKNSYRSVYRKEAINNFSTGDMRLEEERINEEIDRKIYNHSNLKDYGIEFNSQQFKEWLEGNSKHFPVPVDAPAFVRKLVYDTLEANKDSRCWFNLLKNFTRGFREIKDTSNVNEYLKVTDNMLKNSKDYLNLLVENSSNEPLFKQTIADYRELVSELLKFKGRLGNIKDKQE